MDKLQIINRNSEINLNPKDEIISVVAEASEIHTETDLPNVGGDLDAFLPISKVPLITDLGGYSKAHSIRLEKDGKEVEMGVVGKDYLLVANDKLMDVAQEIMGVSGMDFIAEKKFFNGKQFRYVWRINDAGLQVEVPEIGDIMSVAMMINNSYDGSLKAGIQVFLMRLSCLNGQVSKVHGWGIDFRHYMTDGIDWERNILEAGRILGGKNMELLPKRFAKGVSRLAKPISLQDLATIRTNEDYLGKLPAQQFAQMQDKMFADGMVTNEDEYTAYDLFNAGTNVLWHQPKMTTASFKNNALVVDGMMNYGKDTQTLNIPDPNQQNIFN